MKTALELRRDRAALVAMGREILDAAPTANLSGEDETRYQRIETDLADLEKQIERVEAQETREKSLGDPVASAFKSKPGDPEIDNAKDARAARAAEVRKFFRSGPTGEMEFRALQSNTDTAGGYTFAAEQFVADLIQALDNETFMLGQATVIDVTSSDTIGFPSLDADPAAPDWTTEVATVNADSTMAFGKRQMTPNPLAKLIKVSNNLLRISALNPEDLVKQRFAYKFATTLESAFMTGTGSGQPLGMFVASSLGISTGQDVSTGSATNFTSDGMIDAFYKLAPQYSVKASWILHRDGVKLARKLKDSTNQYLWQPGLAGSQPDTLLGRPIFQSEYAPNTFTTGLYVGIFGVLSYYWVARSLNYTIQRLNELYAANNQVGFIARSEFDGAPVLESAFARLKTA